VTVQELPAPKLVAVQVFPTTEKVPPGNAGVTTRFEAGLVAVKVTTTLPEEIAFEK
jgi:hypothetical protein